MKWVRRRDGETGEGWAREAGKGRGRGSPFLTVDPQPALQLTHRLPQDPLQRAGRPSQVGRSRQRMLQPLQAGIRSFAGRPRCTSAAGLHSPPCGGLSPQPKPPSVLSPAGSAAGLTFPQRTRPLPRLLPCSSPSRLHPEDAAAAATRRALPHRSQRSAARRFSLTRGCIGGRHPRDKRPEQWIAEPPATPAGLPCLRQAWTERGQA